MKYFFALISFLFIIETSNAQLFKKEKVTYDANQGRGSTDNKLLRWGYYLGVSNYDFNFEIVDKGIMRRGMVQNYTSQFLDIEEDNSKEKDNKKKSKTNG